jgi:hypothetical protein
MTCPIARHGAFSRKWPCLRILPSRRVGFAAEARTFRVVRVYLLILLIFLELVRFHKIALTALFVPAAARIAVSLKMPKSGKPDFGCSIAT